jgi:hypothetical protein
VVLGVVVERPVAFGADLETGPGPVLLRREHDRNQSADGMIQPPLFGREQLQPTSLIGPGAQVCGAGSVVERLSRLRGER